MKNYYFTILALCFSAALNAQEAFWTVTNYRGAFPVTDNTTATNWASGWSNFDPENAVYGAPTTTISADITTNTTLSGIVLLQNKVFVKNNAILTIQPGTIIRGDKLTQGTLIITRGAKIIANGTATNPIVMTSNEAVGARNEGDWGGLVILGLAKNNQPGGVANVEGLVVSTDTQFGGNFDNDNSGILKYVRVEFSGIALQPNKETNGITFGSVGSATQVDFVQVSFSGDDSFEWFGGTVNCKHLIAYRGLDDDFDTDFGYRGKVQFGLAIRDKDLSDAPGDSNCFESDNDATGSAAQPKTSPIFSNMTIVGPKGNGSIVLPIGEKFEKAFRLRRNCSTSVFNSLITGWEKGLSFESAGTVANVNGDTLKFANNSLSNFSTNANVITSVDASVSFYAGMFNANSNDSTNTIAQINWVSLFPALGNAPDARLNSTSTVATTASFMANKFYNLPTPTATLSYTYCAGATATALTATAAIGNSLKWYTQATGGTAATTAPTPATSAGGTFTYYVSQSNAAGDESKRVAITVTVNAAPAVPTITANGPTTFCTGGNVVLTSSATTGNVWSTNATTAAITVNTSGSYIVTVTDANGCSTVSSSTTVNVSNAPVPTINASATSGCSGDTIVLTASTSDSYTWSNGATTQAINVIAGDTFTVVSTNSNACNGVGTSAPVIITFTQTPTAAGSFTINGNIVTFANTSTNATSYSWDFNDFTNSSAMAPTHAFAGNGVYNVVLTAINGACQNTAELTVAITVGVEELAGLEEVKLFPNPTSSNAMMVINSKENTTATIAIVNQLGQLISTNTISLLAKENNFDLNVNTFDNGIYTIIISTELGNVTRRLVVQK